MSRRKGFVGAIVLFAQVFVLAAVITLVHGSPGAKADNLIDITGTVTNASSQPEANISVYATDPGTDTVDFGPVTTGQDGTYDLQVAAGTYDIHFDAPSGSNLNTTVDSNVTVLADQTINEQLSITTATFSGVFTEGAIPGMLLTLTATDGTTVSGYVGADGSFSITAPSENYMLSLQCPSNPVDDHLDACSMSSSPLEDVYLAYGNVNQSLELNVVTLHVSVKNVNGDPVSNVPVTAQTDSSNAGYTFLLPTPDSPQIYYQSITDGTPGDPAITDSNGNVDLTTFGNAIYGTAYATGSICADVSGTEYCNATPVRGDDQNITILTGTPTFSGTVTDSSGNPVPGITVALTAEDGNAASGTTDSNGNFSIPATADDYLLSLYGADGSLTQLSLSQANPASIDLTNGNVTQNLQLATATLHVTVLGANGAPVPGVSVTASSSNDSNDVDATSLYPGDPGESMYVGSNQDGALTTDSNGTIDLTTILGAEYTRGTICALVDGLEDCNTDVQINVTGNTNVTIDTYGTYSGSVILGDAGSGAPGVGVVVTLLASDGNTGSAVTDANGNFSITVPRDVYAVDVNCPGPSAPLTDHLDDCVLQEQVPSLDLSIEGNINDESIGLSIVDLHVTVDDIDGNPIPNARVSAQSDTTNIDSTEIAFFELRGGDEYVNSVTSGEASDPAITGADGSVDLGSIRNANYNTTYGSSICAEVQSHEYCISSPALNVEGDQNITITTDTIAPPIAPTGLTAQSPTAVPMLSWNASAGATSYNVYRNGTEIGTTTGTSYTDSSATPGVYSYAVTAVSSNGEGSPSGAISVIVGTAPAITSLSSASASMRTPFSFTVTTTGDPTPSLSESGTLPAGITFVDNGDGTATFSGEAIAGTAGTYPVTITASNGVGSGTSQNFTLTVTTNTSAPAITSSTTDTETFGAPFSFIVTTDGYPVPTLTKSGSLPNGITFVDNSDGTATIAGTPAQSAVGVYPITIKAKNSVTTASQSFVLTITKSPVIKNLPNSTTSHVGSAYSLTIKTSGYTIPSLSESGALPAGISFVDNGDGTATLSGTPQVGSGGTYSLTVTASNQLGSSSQTMTFKVDEGPVITSANNATAIVGQSSSFQVTATGYPIPNISKLGKLPKGLSWKGSTGTISGTPAAGTQGTYTYSFTAKNSTGSTTQIFTLTVQ
jgi:hypothetical protein